MELNILEILQIFFAGIMFIISIIVTIFLIFGMNYDKSMNISLKLITISLCIGFSITNITLILLILGENKYDIFFAFSWIFDNAIWTISQIFMYYLFIWRLLFIFANSVYELKLRTKILLYLLLFVYGCCCLSDSLNAIIPVKPNLFNAVDYELKGKYVLSIVLMILRVLVHILISITFMYLFVSKLILLIESQNDNRYNSLLLELNDKQATIINVITKQTILTSIAINSSIIYHIGILIIRINYENINQVIFFFVTLYMSFDAFINILCVYLGFRFANQYYIKLCNNCDDSIRLHFTKSIKDKIVSKSNPTNNPESISELSKVSRNSKQSNSIRNNKPT